MLEKYLNFCWRKIEYYPYRNRDQPITNKELMFKNSFKNKSLKTLQYVDFANKI